jgi:hypothetical protein
MTPKFLLAAAALLAMVSAIDQPQSIDNAIVVSPRSHVDDRMILPHSAMAFDDGILILTPRFAPIPVPPRPCRRCPSHPHRAPCRCPRLSNSDKQGPKMIAKTAIPVVVSLFVMMAATSAHASFWCRDVPVPGGGWKYVCTTIPGTPPQGPGPGPSRIYGAIAYSPASGAYGYSDNYGSKTLADNRALSECGRSDCVVASWFYNNCGAVAVSGSGSWAGGHGETKASAISDAENECTRQGGSACVVKVTHCSI